MARRAPASHRAAARQTERGSSPVRAALMRGTDAFITSRFLLPNRQAERLYHEYAEGQPIIDYHCHLPPEQVASDRRFENLTAIWLAGDHYKWRAMRANGIPERCITGDASAWDKFRSWSETVPKCLRNPLYHWTHLELKRPFGVSDVLLGPDTAKSIWERCNERLAEPGFTARGIMQRMDVRVVCTTDDPVDSLEHHQATARDRSFPVQMRPTWRPDKGMAVDQVPMFNEWLDRLGVAANTTIRTFPDYMAALRVRHDFFHANGCRLSDHGLDTVYAETYTDARIAAIFAKARSGSQPTPDETVQFKSAMLYEWALMDHAKGWVQQFHIGAMRNNNQRMFRALGADHGYDSIGDANYAQSLSRLLDRLDGSDQLAKTIIYNLNPRDNEMIATMIGNFQGGGIAGKIQFGSGWWFLDQKDGMEKQLDALSNMGLVSRFVGMLTDSRSFLSYTRHEYFRRILCAKLGQEMSAGLLPNDLKLIGEMVTDICYRNAAKYFDFGIKF